MYVLGFATSYWENRSVHHMDRHVHRPQAVLIVLCRAQEANGHGLSEKLH